MKVKISKLLELYILILIILNTSLTKIGYPFLGYFASTHHITILTALSAVLLAIICNVHRPIRSRISAYCGFLDKISLYTLFICFAETIYTAMNYNLPLSGFVFVLYSYVFILLSYPLMYIVICEKENLQQIIRAVIICTFLSFVLRWIVAAVYNQTGETILPTLATEYASAGWIRNGKLRINPPCFIVLMIPAAMYMISKSRTTGKRIFYELVIVISVGYTLFVHQARSVVLYLVFTFLICYLLKKKKPLIQMVSVFMIFGLVMTLAQTDYAGNLMASFKVSAQNKYSSSTSLRLTSIRYYSGLFKKNPLLGIGALWTSNEDTLSILRSSTGKCFLEDIGLLGGIFRFGVLGSGVYGLILARMLLQIKNMCKYCQMEKEKLLLIGIFVSKAVFSINIDWFFGLVAFSLPFEIMLFEYYGTRKNV